MARRPLIVIPARFAATTSATRFGGLVTARALSASVLRAGGEPLTVHPWAPDGDLADSDIAARLSFADGVLLPGGGDVDPRSYGARTDSAEVYDVDAEQDAFDLAVARWAIDTGVPLLAVCRGLQVVNVALGGTLEQHMAEPHRHLTHQVSISAGTPLAHVVGTSVEASCFHHQRIDVLAPRLTAVAHAADGSVEGVDLTEATGWFMAVQWHPEDLADSNPANQSLFDALVTAARG